MLRKRSCPQIHIFPAVSKEDYVKPRTLPVGGLILLASAEAIARSRCPQSRQTLAVTAYPFEGHGSELGISLTGSRNESNDPVDQRVPPHDRQWSSFSGISFPSRVSTGSRKHRFCIHSRHRTIISPGCTAAQISRMASRLRLNGVGPETGW